MLSCTCYGFLFFSYLLPECHLAEKWWDPLQEGKPQRGADVMPLWAASTPCVPAASQCWSLWGCERCPLKSDSAQMCTSFSATREPRRARTFSDGPNTVTHQRLKDEGPSWGPDGSGSRSPQKICGHNYYPPTCCPPKC